MSRDKTRFYTVEAGMEKVEIIDIAARKTIDTFTMSSGNRKVRIKSLEPDPMHRFVMMVIRPVRKEIDRFVIEPSSLVQYDLSKHEIVKTVAWPKDEERENANIQFSPDGKFMYLFSEQDVLIFDATTFAQVDKWELSKPVEPGFGAFEFGPEECAPTFSHRVEPHVQVGKCAPKTCRGVRERGLAFACEIRDRPAAPFFVAADLVAKFCQFAGQAAEEVRITVIPVGDP